MKRKIFLSIICLALLFSVFACGNETWESDETQHWIEGKFEKNNHVFGEWSTNSEHHCGETCEHSRECIVCGFVQTEEYIAGHIMDSIWESNENSHWKKCVYCEQTEENALHTYAQKKKVGEEDRYEIYKSVCTVCGYEKTERELAWTPNF